MVDSVSVNGQSADAKKRLQALWGSLGIWICFLSFFLSFWTFARFLQECLSSSRLMTLQRRMWPITPNKPCGDTIQLCGCCGMEQNISQHSCSFLPASGSTCCACGKENNWRKMLKASEGRWWPFRASKTCKQKPSAEKYLHSLVAHKRIKERAEEPFPDQLHFHTLEIN